MFIFQYSKFKFPGFGADFTFHNKWFPAQAKLNFAVCSVYRCCSLWVPMICLDPLLWQLHVCACSPQSVRNCPLCMRECLGCSNYAHVKHCALLKNYMYTSLQCRHLVLNYSQLQAIVFTTLMCELKFDWLNKEKQVYQVAKPGSSWVGESHIQGDQNAKILWKNIRNWSKFEEGMRKVELLPTWDCEASYGPGSILLRNHFLG